MPLKTPIAWALEKLLMKIGEEVWKPFALMLIARQVGFEVKEVQSVVNKIKATTKDEMTPVRVKELNAEMDHAMHILLTRVR